jgi:hypothetical protein
LNIAKGSAGETRSLFRVALEIGYFNKETYEQLRERALTLSRYLFNQIKGDQKYADTVLTLLPFYPFNLFPLLSHRCLVSPR